MKISKALFGVAATAMFASSMVPQRAMAQALPTATKPIGIDVTIMTRSDHFWLSSTPDWNVKYVATNDGPIKINNNNWGAIVEAPIRNCQYLKLGTMFYNNSIGKFTYGVGVSYVRPFARTRIGTFSGGAFAAWEHGYGDMLPVPLIGAGILSYRPNNIHGHRIPALRLNIVPSFGETVGYVNAGITLTIKAPERSSGNRAQRALQWVY